MWQLGTVDNPDRRDQLAFQVEYAGVEGVWRGADRVVVKAWATPASPEMDEETVAVITSLTAEQARELAEYLVSAAYRIEKAKEAQEIATAVNDAQSGR